MVNCTCILLIFPSVPAVSLSLFSTSPTCSSAGNHFIFYQYNQQPEFNFKFNSSEPPAVREALDSYCNDRRRSYEFFNWVESECKFDHATETQTRMLDILGKFFEFDLSWVLIHHMQ